MFESCPRNQIQVALSATFFLLNDMHKAGFINIVGLPNVGKSTLLNALIGEILAITSPKAQTTRHRIKGIVNEADYQLIYCDSPGYVNEPAYALHKSMNTSIIESFEDADCIILVTDKFQSWEEQSFLINQCSKTKAAVLIVLNKIDITTEEEVKNLHAQWMEKIPNAVFIPVSAQNKGNVQIIHDKVKEQLPESPAYFDKEEMTDRQTRFFVSEIVREKIFHRYQKEIPYSCEVTVDEYKEGDTIDKIYCTIWVERDSQRGIIIGREGTSLTKLGTDARIAVEKFLGKKVFLKLIVKIKINWRDTESTLKSFGY